MKCPLKVLLMAFVSAALMSSVLSAQAPASYVISNDDGITHSYLSFFAPSGTQSAPSLTFSFNVNTLGVGIGGGFFGLPRIAMLPNQSTNCLYASNAQTADITGVNIQTRTVSGNFTASDGDAGDAQGIGVLVNANYLYAAYTSSNTIATFSVQTGCQLSFLNDTPAAGLNGGSITGMALHGSMLVVAYGDGSIESFNVANGTPVSNGDAQNSTGYTLNITNFPEGVDITSDGHFAIFGDSSVRSTVEVSDISSGHLTTTTYYNLGGGANIIGPTVGARATGVNSGAVRLSPDQTMIFVGNNDGGSVTGAMFNAQTGRIGSSCSSPRLTGYYNPWAFTGSLVTRDNTGNGGVLYVAEYGYAGSYLGVVKIQNNGMTCSLTESSASEIPDEFSGGTLSLATYPPRTF
jgi:hypothetical protein